MAVLGDNGGCHHVRVGVTVVRVKATHREHPPAPQQVAGQQLLGRRAGRERACVVDDGARTVDVLLEVSRGRRWHVLPPIERRLMPKLVERGSLHSAGVSFDSL